ncbi:MAG: hypothetical protein RBT66_09750 [bacterium]|jgi:hypothetical protein|nr:hypothetical protein [bacterium]
MLKDISGSSLAKTAREIEILLEKNEHKLDRMLNAGLDRSRSYEETEDLIRRLSIARNAIEAKISLLVK